MDDATASTQPDDAPAEARGPSVGDTQAFKAFYLEEPTAPPRPSLFHRLFVGWWRDRGT